MERSRNINISKTEASSLGARAPLLVLNLNRFGICPRACIAVIIGACYARVVQPLALYQVSCYFYCTAVLTVQTVYSSDAELVCHHAASSRNEAVIDAESEQPFHFGLV